jgi:hypothetical protein
VYCFHKQKGLLDLNAPFGFPLLAGESPGESSAAADYAAFAKETPKGCIRSAGGKAPRFAATHPSFLLSQE